MMWNQTSHGVIRIMHDVEPDISGSHQDYARCGASHLMESSGLSTMWNQTSHGVIRIKHDVEPDISGSHQDYAQCEGRHLRESSR